MEHSKLQCPRMKSCRGCSCVLGHVFLPRPRTSSAGDLANADANGDAGKKPGCISTLKLGLYICIYIDICICTREATKVQPEHSKLPCP